MDRQARQGSLGERLLTAPDSQIATDLCILGAGPAGIAIARACIGRGLAVCLVESGDVAPAAETQELARGARFGDPTHPPEEICQRGFGGNAHAWHIRTGAEGDPHVRHMPLQAQDFEARDWIPDSGWPIDRPLLDPFYARAQILCGAGAFDYDPAGWETPGARRLPLPPEGLETAIYQFAPADIFHRLYREELWRAERAGGLRILLRTTALRLLGSEDGGTVRELLCARADGSPVSVRARAFILATGGFENARLLLMSRDHDPRGLGNAHDVVGRYYHDHPLVQGGILRPRGPGLFGAAAFYDIHQVRGVPVMGHLRLSPEAQRRHRLRGISACLFPRPGERETDAIEAFRDLLRGAEARRVPERPLSVLRRMARRPAAVARAAIDHMRGDPLLCGFAEGGWSRRPARHGGWRSFHVYHQVEQTPERENRVTLGATLDRFGCPGLEVHWRWGAEDAQSVARAQRVMAAAFAQAGIGDFAIAEDGGEPRLLRPSGTHHLMGTTRMHADPRQGVVDADCRVHGVENLFIAGSSVFPTGGYANPTLTILALALRLADHVRGRLRRQMAPALAPAVVPTLVPIPEPG